MVVQRRGIYFIGGEFRVVPNGPKPLGRLEEMQHVLDLSKVASLTLQEHPKQYISRSAFGSKFVANKH